MDSGNKTSIKEDNRSAQDTCCHKRVPANRYLIFLCIALSGLALDLFTKSWIFSKLWPPMPNKPGYLWLWEGHVGLQISLNEGAVFGIGQGMVVWFTLLSVLAILGIGYWLFILGEARNLWLTVALGGISAGILGNLYDRTGMHGLVWPWTTERHQQGTPIYAVRDWILLQWNDDLRWPNFNIADSFLVCGAILLLVHAYISKRKQREQNDAEFQIASRS